MAVIKSFLPKNYQENEEQKKGLAQSNPLQPVSTGAPATIGGGAAAAPAAPGPSSTGRFVNIQKYVGANNAAKDADKLTGFVQNKSDDVKTKIANESAKINSAINLEGRGFDDNTKSMYKGLLDKKLSGATLDKADEDKLVAGLGGNYSGADFSGLHKLQNEALSAASSGAQLGNESGRYQLLSKVFGRPGYNAGQSTLDQALIQSDPNAAAKLAATKQAVLAEGAGAEYLKQSDALRAQDAAKAKAVADLKGYLSDTSATGGAAQFATGDAASQTAAAEANNRDALIDQFQKALKNSMGNYQAGLQADALGAKLGLTPEQLTAARKNAKAPGANKDPNAYINLQRNTGTATWQDKLTPEQKAAYSWLAQQIGQSGPASSDFVEGSGPEFTGKSVETLNKERADRAAASAQKAAAIKAAKEEAARAKEAARLQAIEDATQEERRGAKVWTDALSALSPVTLIANLLGQGFGTGGSKTENRK